MTKQSLAFRVLITVYRATSHGRCLTVSSLSQLTEIHEKLLALLLLELDRAGWVDRAQLRLTLAGLAVAVAASAKRKPRALSKAA